MVLVSGLSHAVYFGSLGKAYEAGDLSQFILALGSSVFLVPTLSVPDGANLRNGGARSPWFCWEFSPST